MQISTHAKHIERVLSDNSPAILTGIGVVGSITSAYFAGTASFKAAQIIAEEQSFLEYDMTNKQKAKLVWRLYIPAAGTLVITGASIICANRIGTRRAAALAAAYGTLDKTFKEYKEKVIEKIGDQKEHDVRAAVAQDRINENPPQTAQIIVTETGNVLCRDSLTDRYFRSSLERIRKAQNDVNAEVYNNMYASLSDFYIGIGLPPTSLSDELGWNTDKPCELYFVGAITPETGEPCIDIQYSVSPVRNYHKIG
jgi:hypothetical protein